MDAAEDVLEMRRLFCDYCGKEISDDKKKRTVTIDDSFQREIDLCGNCVERVRNRIKEYWKKHGFDLDQ